MIFPGENCLTRQKTLGYKFLQKLPAMLPFILIADDYADNRELLRLMLASAGYEVGEARDGQECLRMARERAPDLIMIDLSMPVLDGWRLLEELKADPRTSHVPCIAVTAYAGFDQNRALQAGFTAYLCKPFRSEDLLNAVRKVLPSPTVKAEAANRKLER